MHNGDAYNEDFYMHAERLILTTDPAGNLAGLPKFPPNRKVEVILLLLDDIHGTRCPHPDIAGKAVITGDIFDTSAEVAARVSLQSHLNGKI